jgi:hypothetical protein
MAVEINFHCQTCQADFPLLIGSVESDFMGTVPVDVNTCDAQNAQSFVNAVTEHRCENRDIRMENNYSKVD